MRRVKLVLLGIVLGMSACLLVAASPFVYGYVTLPVEDGRGHDGRSLETAVVIEAEYEEDAINVEYLWMVPHCPTCTLVSQSLVQVDGRSYDVLEWERPNGEPYVVYFDITRAFGHYAEW
jgi:hypothetical protein